MNVLEIKNLTKNFTSVKALDNVSFTVGRGELCGLLGPNGAGKTTLLRIINSLLVFDQGSVTINGQPASLKAGRSIGYMPEERGLYEKMKVKDQIMYFGLLKGGNEARLRVVMNEYLDIFNLMGQENRKVKELSKGNQQKVQIISTLVHEPELVILDEPFSGFDPINGALLKQLIARLREKGSTIMLSSHNMESVEEMCSTMALINHGQLLIKGGLADIKDYHKTNDYLLTTSSPLSLPLLLDSGLFQSVNETVTQRGRKGHSYILKKQPGSHNADLIQAVAIQSEVLQFEERLPSLRDIFLQYTNPEPRQEAAQATPEPQPFLTNQLN